MDLNHQPPGPESMHGSRENQSKALNRRRIDEQLSPLIGLLIGLQIVSPTLGQRTSAWLPAALPQGRRGRLPIHDPFTRRSQGPPINLLPRVPQKKQLADYLTQS